jgi:hypothetical protein
MKPDVGILSKDFLKTKGREQTVDKQFAIHQKKRAAVDVDVGILSNGRRQQQTSRVNLHAKNEVTGRSLLPDMCPNKDGYPGLAYFDNLFDETDGYFPKCSCPSPTTCGPSLCECLELDADGDIFQCMDPFKQLCEGTMYIEGIPGPWSMEECLGLGNKLRAIYYCSYLPCFVDGGSWLQCKCKYHDRGCTEYRDAEACAKSKCCQATDDEGREACFNGGWQNYYDQVTSFSFSNEGIISRFNECSLNSDSSKSIVECYCESFSYGLCVNDGVADPDLCEANICCDGQTEDAARLDCFSRFRGRETGSQFYKNSDAIQESCVASGKSSDQCKCDIQGLTNCVYGVEIVEIPYSKHSREPSCDLFQCCQSQTSVDDEGRKYCLAQDEAQFMYDNCALYAIYGYGGSPSSCFCDKSNTLCVSGHSNDRHCELSSCCREQVDDTGRKECIDNFTTSQPSSAPSESTPAEESIDDVEASPSATSALPGTSSASISTSLDLGVKPLAKTTSKMLAVTAAVVGWLLFS